VLWAVTSSYFAGVMVRLVLAMAPVWAVASGVGVSWVLDIMSASRDWLVKSLIALPLLYTMVTFIWHGTWITSQAYSAPSIIMASTNPDGSPRIIDDFREAYSWLRHNTDPAAKVLAWWDYGYQIAGMADRTTIVDNNTWNNTHIATVGLVMASEERVAYPILQSLDVDYILVLFGGVSGFTGDDLNKLLWMVRIAQGVYPTRLRESLFYTPSTGEFRVDQRASDALKRSLLYKMSYYRYPQIMGRQAVDRARQVQVSGVDPKLDTLVEVYSTENYIVRIYAVKPVDGLGRSHHLAV
jgi:dolichyl-diphosphooligosaccharide--protein glycosyltransferase